MVYLLEYGVASYLWSLEILYLADKIIYHILKDV